MRRLWILTLFIPLSLFWLSGCGTQSPLSFLQPSYKSQPDCGYVQNVYGERVSWKGQTPIRLVIHKSVPTEYYSALESAIQKWEASAGKPLFQIVAYGQDGPLTPRQDGVNIIYMMNTWEDNKVSEQARTSVYWVGDAIREADIRLNDKNFNFYTTTPTQASDVHLESLLIHELGHVLGLKHREDGGTVMATYLSSATNRTAVAAVDQDSLRCEY